MIDWWLTLSIEFRLVAIGLFGVFLTPFLNWSVYNAAYFPLPISPWNRWRFRDAIRKHFEEIKRNDLQHTNSKSNSNKPALERSAIITEGALLHPPIQSRWPIVGWLWLRHEESIFGARFWLRPMCIELFFPVFLAWFYYFETTGGLLPPIALQIVPRMQLSLHLQYLGHAMLCCLMCIATFIDFDERTIPDWVTIPGTILGLLFTSLGSLFAPTHLWTSAVDEVNKNWPTVLDWTSPFQAADSLPIAQQLLLGMACFALWCFAIADRRLRLRRGWKKAIMYFLAGLTRRPSWKLIFTILIVGELSVFALWSILPVDAWRATLSSLVGMAVGGLLVWVVRIVAGAAMGIEALGFGDVTLMFMVGAFLGWQPVWIAFFVAPIVAIVFVVAMYLVTGDNQLPFGPYLCVGTLLTLIGWNALWNERMQPMISVIGLEMLVLLVLGLLLMGLMLWGWRIVKGRILR